jgi:hypothetical protein
LSLQALEMNGAGFHGLLRTVENESEAHPPEVRLSPDKQEKATLTVLEQAEVLSEGWAVG